jgi:hypothetical protein
MSCQEHVGTMSCHIGTMSGARERRDKRGEKGEEDEGHGRDLVGSKMKMKERGKRRGRAGGEDEGTVRDSVGSVRENARVCERMHESVGVRA